MDQNKALDITAELDAWVREAELLAECAEQKDYFEQIGEAVPAEFEQFRQDLARRVS